MVLVIHKEKRINKKYDNKEINSRGLLEFDMYV